MLFLCLFSLEYFIFIFRGGIGMNLGNCHFQRIASKEEKAADLVTEALITTALQLLVVILPGKLTFYGRSLNFSNKCP